MSNQVDVSIIVINYKTYQDTVRCINSIIQYTHGCSFEIILVENGTGEFNPQNVLQWSSNIVKLVVSSKNLGFAGGNNLGINNSFGKYILLLNSDTYLIEDSISKSLKFYESQSNIGALSAKLIYPDGRVQSIAQRFPSVKYGLIELFRIQKIFGQKWASKKMLGAFFNHDTTIEVDWVWGAFFLTKRSIIDSLPGAKLNDDYFMYWEDVQWCIDIKKLGYKIFFFAETSVVHIQEGSKGKTNDNLLKSEALFFSKNYSRIHFKLIKFVNRLLS